MKSLPPTFTALRSPQLPALDALRMIAAFLVVFNHAGLAGVPGSLGVLAFFVLSGFLITWLLLREDAKLQTVSLKRFYIRRTLRIFPAFYVYWLLIVGSRLALHRPLDWSQAIASFFYVNNYYQAIYGDPNTALSHTWSLGVEEQFYLLWPVVFLSLRKKPASMAKALAICVGFLWVYRIALHFAGVSQAYVYEAFDCRADHLAIGCLLAVALHNGWLKAVWLFLCRYAAFGLITVALLVLSSALYAFYGTPYRDTIGFIVEPVLVAIFLVQSITFSVSAGGWRWLNAAPVRYLGRISYSTYLYQQIVPNYVEKLRLPFPLQMMLIIAVTVALASASYFLVEKPFLRLKERFAAN